MHRFLSKVLEGNLLNSLYFVSAGIRMVADAVRSLVHLISITGLHSALLLLSQQPCLSLEDRCVKTDKYTEGVHRKVLSVTTELKGNQAQLMRISRSGEVKAQGKRSSKIDFTHVSNRLVTCLPRNSFTVTGNASLNHQPPAFFTSCEICEN